MRPLIRIPASALFLLSVPAFAAEPPAPTDFAMELILPAGPRSAGVIEVRCIDGCDWTRKTLACPEGPDECRRVIAGREGYEPQPNRQSQLAYPIKETACLGWRLVTAPVESIHKCEEFDDERGKGTSCNSEEVPRPDSRVYVNDVHSGSPAEGAGILATDVVLRFNDKPVHVRMDVINMMREMKAGQPFTVLLERDGAPMTLHGKFGIGMSDHTCGVATPERLAAATAWEAPLLVPFKLSIRAPGTRMDWNCLEGCGTPGNATGGTSCGSAPGEPQCAVSVTLTHGTNGIDIGTEVD